MLSHRARIEKIYINQKVKKTSSFICDVIGEKYLLKKTDNFFGEGKCITHHALWQALSLFHVLFPCLLIWDFASWNTPPTKENRRTAIVPRSNGRTNQREKGLPFSLFERCSFSLAKFFSASVLYNVFPIMKCLYFHVPC